MATTPIRPGTKPDEIDPETERIIMERLATFDEDVRDATDAREAIEKIREKLRQQKRR